MAPPWKNTDFDVLSLDVFDTVLLRRPVCERRRFAASAKLFARRAAASGRTFDPAAVFHARYEAHTITYRAKEAHEPDGDVSLATIFEVTADVLGLSDRLARELHAAEFAYETDHLIANTALIEHVRATKRAGKRVVALSDTYFPGSDLQRLIEAVVGKVVFDKVYASVDLDATKRSGAAFGVLAEAEGVAPDRIFHMGDHRWSDLTQAEKAGCRAAWRPRSLAHRLGVRADAVRFGGLRSWTML